VSPKITDLNEVLEQWKSSATGAHKIMLMGEASDIAILFETLSSTFGNDIHIYRSKDTYLELAPRRISKATALAMIMKEWYRTSLSNVVAFGDNYNDIEMIKSVGFGIAMGNSRPEVQAVAFDRTVDNKEDGVAIALEKYALVINANNI